MLVAGAWIAALACVVFAQRSYARARTFSCPPLPALVADARLATKDAPPGAAALQAEIADRSGEALRALSIAAFVPRGAARVSLAAGTAFAVLVLALLTAEAPMTAVIGALGAFTGGALGAVTAANIGHRARAWAAEQRTLWVRAARDAQREIAGS